MRDLHACYDRDPACDRYIMPLLYFKGYQSIQAQRFAHYAWQEGHKGLAYFLQNMYQYQKFLMFLIESQKINPIYS